MIESISIVDNVYNIYKIELDFEKNTIDLVLKEEYIGSYIKAFKQFFIILKQATLSRGKYDFNVTDSSNHIFLTGNITNIIIVLTELKIFDNATNIKLEKYYKPAPTDFFAPEKQLKNPFLENSDDSDDSDDEILAKDDNNRTSSKLYFQI